MLPDTASLTNDCSILPSTTPLSGISVLSEQDVAMKIKTRKKVNNLILYSL
jgi:hypothetical protein